MNLNIVIAQLETDLQKELSILSDKWQIRSNVRWIEDGEKSTKYFYDRFKQRHDSKATSDIKDPEAQATKDPLEALDYIKRYFESVYKTKAFDSSEVEAFTNKLPEISHEQNSLLTKEISTEEIIEVINSLPANKSPGPVRVNVQFLQNFH